MWGPPWLDRCQFVCQIYWNFIRLRPIKVGKSVRSQTSWSCERSLTNGRAMPLPFTTFHWRVSRSAAQLSRSKKKSDPSLSDKALVLQTCQCSMEKCWDFNMIQSSWLNNRPPPKKKQRRSSFCNSSDAKRSASPKALVASSTKLRSWQSQQIRVWYILRCALQPPTRPPITLSPPAVEYLCWPLKPSTWTSNCA